jgi:hypothetical protein
MSISLCRLKSGNADPGQSTGNYELFVNLDV